VNLSVLYHAAKVRFSFLTITYNFSGDSAEAKTVRSMVVFVPSPARTYRAIEMCHHQISPLPCWPSGTATGYRHASEGLETWSVLGLQPINDRRTY
jgi:hypothetical protein